MKRAIGLLGMVSFALITLSGCAAHYAHFGEPMKVADGDAISIEKVLADPEAYHSKFIRVAGTVRKVCESKGCWLSMRGRSDDDTIFVKFTCPVEDRLIPMEAVGHKVEVEGTLTVMEISASEARHYADQAGKSPEEIAKISGPRKQLRITAPAARIAGLAQQPSNANEDD